jgi:hypothetical protein
MLFVEAGRCRDLSSARSGMQINMIVIPVTIGRPVVGHSSPKLAIAAAKAHPKQQKAREDGAF